MNNNIKKILILSLGILSTACSTTRVELNRTLVQQEKIEKVHLKKLPQNVSIERTDSGSSTGGAAGGLLGVLVGSAVDASVNSARKKAFSDIQDSTNVMSANTVLKTALEHNLEGTAFSENIVVDYYDNGIKKPYLTPVLTPSVVMSKNYGVLNVLLTTSTAQKSIKDANKQNQYKGVYSSQQVAESTALTVDKEANKQYWLDNPIKLREKLLNGLYDVAKQFADDFNSSVDQ